MNERQAGFFTANGSDKRGCARYPLTLEVRYAVTYRKKLLQAGSGRLVDMSSSGVRFIAATGPLEPGRDIELSIQWPVPLDGGVELQMKATGTIVWSRGAEIALRLHHHEFRTLKRKLEVR
jgi:hypothetical protein